MDDSPTGPQETVALPACIAVRCAVGSLLLTLAGSLAAQDAAGLERPTKLVLESPQLRVEVEAATARWALQDQRSGVRWPTAGTASPGQFTPPLTGGFAGPTESEALAGSIVLTQPGGGARVAFELIDGGGSLKIIYDGPDEIIALEEALAVRSDEQGQLIVPCREGLFIPADSGVAFQRAFGTSDYEGCHMNMLGLLKSGAALIVGWDDAYVTPELESVLARDSSEAQRIVTRLRLRRSARAVRLTPLGPGDWNTVAAEYRRLAAQQGLAVTLADKIRRQPHAELLVGAANVKLWTCLARRMNEQSTQEESVKVRWTFAEASQIAEHLHNDLDIALSVHAGRLDGGRIRLSTPGQSAGQSGVRWQSGLGRRHPADSTARLRRLPA